VEPIVPSRRPALVLAALSLLAAPAFDAPAHSEEWQCRRGDLLRRVEVQFAGDADRLPCQVLYWRDDETSGGPRVPWRAENQLEFCSRKAREMVDELRGAGWTCEAEAPAQDAAELATDAGAEGASREPAAADAAAPRRPPDNGAADAAGATLEDATARDLRRLNQLSGTSAWRLDSDMATLGDLNGDGIEDGAVLLSHRDQTGGLSHHVLVYVFDGTTFQPVARLTVEAYYQNFTDVMIQDIGEGRIELLLHTPRPGDPACCPSGRRHATFELRAGRLVLAAESDSGA
jgi:hypothetical protein